MLKNRENLLPTGMMIRHFVGMLFKPIIISALISATLIIGYNFGCKMISNNYNQMAFDIEKDSYSKQYELLSARINTQEQEIKDINQKIVNSQTDMNILNEKSRTNIQLQNLVDFIVTSRPYGITIVMIEDTYTNQIYSGEGTYKTETIVTKAEDTESGDQETTEPIITDSVIENSSLTYNEQNTFELKVRGFAVDMVLLSEYIKGFEKCEYIESFEIVAVEEVEVADYTINLFEMNIVVKDEGV